MPTIGYPANYSLAIFVLVASQANVVNTRYREVNVQPRKKNLFRLRHVNHSASIIFSKASGLSFPDFVRFVIFILAITKQNYFTK